MNTTQIDALPFPGFTEPESNFVPFPVALIEVLPLIKTIAEMKIIIYVLRHTWGYKEYDEGKRITTDEFQHGRKKRDGTRIDPGTGLSEPAIRDGIEQAVSHGFIKVEEDASDPARIKRYYSLRVQGEKLLTPGPRTSYPWPKNFLPRSEINTLDQDSKINTNLLAVANLPPEQSSATLIADSETDTQRCSETQSTGDSETAKPIVEADPPPAPKVATKGSPAEPAKCSACDGYPEYRLDGALYCEKHADAYIKRVRPTPLQAEDRYTYQDVKAYFTALPQGEWRGVQDIARETTLRTIIAATEAMTLARHGFLETHEHDSQLYRVRVIETPPPEPPAAPKPKRRRSRSSDAKKPESALTKAMYEAIPADIRPPKCFYPTENQNAKPLYDEGITAKQVTDYVQWAYAQDTWIMTGGEGDTQIVMQMWIVAKYIKSKQAAITAWIKAGKPVKTEKKGNQSNGINPTRTAIDPYDIRPAAAAAERHKPRNLGYLDDESDD